MHDLCNKIVYNIRTASTNHKKTITGTPSMWQSRVTGQPNIQNTAKAVAISGSATKYPTFSDALLKKPESHRPKKLY